MQGRRKKWEKRRKRETCSCNKVQIGIKMNQKQKCSSILLSWTRKLKWIENTTEKAYLA